MHGLGPSEEDEDIAKTSVERYWPLGLDFQREAVTFMRLQKGSRSCLLCPCCSSLRTPMNALSRREEETLLKTTKARALKECDQVVREFAECATGRTVSVVWACRGEYKTLQECMLQYTGPEPMAKVQAEYMRLRNQMSPGAERPTVAESTTSQN